MNVFQKIALGYLAFGAFVMTCSVVGILIMAALNRYDS